MDTAFTKVWELYSKGGAQAEDEYEEEEDVLPDMAASVALEHLHAGG